MKHFCCLLIVASFFVGCTTRGKNNSTAKKPVSELDVKEIKAENQRLWEEALAMTFTDTTFLQIEGGMSEEAISTHRSETELVGDRPRNRMIYLAALERMRKHLTLVDGRFVLSAKTGKELLVAEDIFSHVSELFRSWNEGIEEGEYVATKDYDGHYTIHPVKCSCHNH